MRTKCLNDFYKSLENEFSKEYIESLKTLIDEDKLSEVSLTDLITKEVVK